MGGYGSTRWGFHSPKRLVEDSRPFDVTGLLADVPFADGVAGTVTFRGGFAVGFAYALAVGPTLRLRYDVPSPPRPGARSLAVVLIGRPMPRGGVRWYGRCPLAVNGVPCGRPAGRLYLPPREDLFGCRRCHRLGYRSCREHDRRADTFRRHPELIEQLLDRRFPVDIAALGSVVTAVGQHDRRVDRLAAAAEKRNARRRAKRAAKRTPKGEAP